MTLNGIKLERFSALMNGVFVGVGIIFLIWGATDIAFPITERVNVAVFGLLRIILGIISLSVGVGIESVQWAKMGNEATPKEAGEKPLPGQQEPAKQEPVQREPEKQASAQPPPEAPPSQPPQSTPEMTQTESQ